MRTGTGLGPEKEKKIFASRYKLLLPSEAALKAELLHELNLVRRKTSEMEMDYWNDGMSGKPVFHHSTIPCLGSQHLHAYGKLPRRAAEV